MALDYGQVRDLYDTLHGAGVVTQPLPDWAAEMNRLTESNLYSAGLHDNLLKRASHSIDRLLEASGAPELSREFGRTVGEVVGAPEVGAQIGAGLPRMTLNFAPLLIPGVGWGATAARLGLTGLLSGAETYTSTGSPAAGFLSGATAAALPKIADVAEQAVLKRIGGRLVQGPLADVEGNVLDRVSRYFPESVPQRIASFATGQGVAAGALEASGTAQALLQGETPQNPLSVDTLLNLTLGQAPFAAISLLTKGRVSPADRLQHAVDISRKAVAQREAVETLKNKTPIEQIPDITPTPEVDANVLKETDQRLSQLRGEQVKVEDDLTLTLEERVDKINKLFNEEAELQRTRDVVTGQTVLGDSILPHSDRTPVMGKEVARNKDGTWRAVHVSDDPFNPEELRGKVVSYSTNYEPNPVFGFQTQETGVAKYSLPTEQWRTIHDANDFLGRRGKGVETPFLPTQPREPTREEMFGHIRDLQDVEDDIEVAETPAQVHVAITKINDVKAQTDLPPTTDQKLRRRAKAVTDSGLVPEGEEVKVAVKGEARDAARKLTKREQERAIPELSAEEAAEVAARFGEGDEEVQQGFSIITPDKLRHTTVDDIETKPVNDVITDVAEAAIYSNESRRAMAGNDHAQVKKDIADFVDLVEHFGSGHFDLKAAADFLNGRFGTIGWDVEEVKAFLEKPYVKVWQDRLDRGLQNVVARSPQPFTQLIPAGENFVWGIRPIEQIKGLSKEGSMPVGRFRNVASDRGAMSQPELDLLKLVVPEAFKGDTVDVRTLYRLLSERGPVVEVRKLGGQEPIPSRNQQQAQLEHELDTTLPSWRQLDFESTDVFDSLTERQQQLVQDLNQVRGALPENPIGDRIGAPRYSFVAPKPESEMPGYVEGLVRAPQTEAARRETAEVDEAYRAQTGNARFGGTRNRPEVLYRGPHFGSEDTNVLAFYRGYEETLPDGTKAFHVIEVQSDWGQSLRESEKSVRRVGIPPGGVVDHPLLRVYESLALKAAIAHAKEVGATKVILSDAETAMMTEGHDRQVGVRAVDVEGRPLTPEVPQEKGMRLHYDQTLPSAMEKLTGERGEIVDLGVHKATDTEGAMRPENGPQFLQLVDDRNAGRITNEEYLQRTQELRSELASRVTGSPVFRDAGGNPKTQITGRLYDLSKVPDKFTLTGASYTRGGERLGQGEEFYVPRTDEERAVVDQMGLERGGEGLRQYLEKSEIPLIRALAEDLKKFPESLARMKNVLKKMDGLAYVQQNLNRETVASFSHGILKMDEVQRQIVVAEELVHGISIAELDNPAKVQIRDGLENMRQQIVDRLPKELRAAYDRAIETNWYETQQGPLAGNIRDSEIVYSLLDTREFLSRGLSNPIFRRFLIDLPTNVKEGWFHRFTNFVKQLLGIGERVDNSVFAEFLSRTDQLLQTGEYVSAFHNFGEQFYRNLGFSDVLAAGQTQRALGLIASTTHGFTPTGVFEVLDFPTQIRSKEWLDATRGFTRMLQDRGDDFIGHAKVMGELGFKADRNGLQDFSHGLLNGEVSRDSLDVLPQATVDMLFAQVKDYRDVLASIRAAASEKNEGFINLSDSKMLRGVVNESMSMIERVLGAEREHFAARRTIGELQAVAPDGYLSALVGDPARSPPWAEGADQTKKGFGGWVKNFLQPMGQLAREMHEAAEVISKGFQLPANQRKMSSEGLKPFGLNLDALGQGRHELTHESVKRMERTLRNPKIEKAVNQWIYLNQIKGKESDAVTLLPEHDVDVAKALRGLSTQERAEVSEVLTKHQISQQVMQSQTLEKMLQIASTNGAVVAGKHTGLKTSQNITLSETLLRALTTDRSDPQVAQQADAQVSLVQSKMSPEAFLALLRYSQGETEKWKLWQEFYQKNPAWSSGQRYGKYLVEYRRGNRTFLAGVESRKEAEQVAEGGKITSFESNRRAEEDQPPVLGPDSIGVITRLREKEAIQHDFLRGQGFSPNDIEEMRRMSPVEAFATEEAYRGGVPGLRPPPRGLTKGAEELPWLSNHFSWVSKTATYWSRQLLRAQARAHLLDPEIAQNEVLQKRLKTHFDNILHPDPEFAQHANRFVTTWFMGFNPASAIVNATQPFLTHVAELTALTGRPLSSYRRVLTALDEVKNGIGNRGWKSADHEWLMKQAAEDGERSYSMFDDQAAAQETIDTNYKRVLAGNRTQTLGQRLSTASGAYTTAGMWMFKGVERLNNEAALLASFDYYREQGLSREDAQAKAYEFNHSVNYGGGRAQRPTGSFSGRGPFPRSAAMIATSMQSYVLGTTFQLARYIERGFFRPQGVTPHEVYAARKAATQMLATQLVAAGTLGLPFVSGAIALLNTAFPGLELNRRVREMATDLFSSDKENGSILADAAMTGVPSMFGWDLQSRLSMGNTVPGVSEVNGFQPELLLGAPANLVSTFVKGGQALAQGQLGRGTEAFVPSALKKITELLSTGGTVKDYRERPLFEPTRGESLGIALGFQPKRLSDFNAATRIAKQTEDVSARRVGQFHQSQAEDVLKGNFGTVRQALLSRSQDDKTYNPLEGVRAVARAAEELTFPRDLRREGSQSTSSARSRLLSAFRIDPQAPSEVARLQFRTQVEQRLGLPSAPQQSDLRIASLMDDLRRQQPGATRVELRRAAEKVLRRPRFQTLTSETE